MTGDLFALLTGLCFAMASLFARAGSDLVDRRVGLLLSLIANAALLAAAAVTVLLWRGVEHLSTTGAALFALAGVAGSLLGRMASLGSIHRLGPSRASLYKNGQPVITTTLAVLVLHEPFALPDAAGGVLILTGAVVASRADPAAMDVRGAWDVQPGQRRLGIQLALLSALGYAAANLLRKLGIDAWPEPVLGATIGVVVALLISGRPGTLPRLAALRRQPARGVVCFAAFGACSAAAQLLFLFALERTTVWTANVLMSMEPVLTILLSTLLFRGRERFSRPMLAGVVLVVTGSVLMLTL